MPNLSINLSAEAPSVLASIDQQPKAAIPVTLITGFLGSGKTTMLNYILSHSQDLNVAVLVNEFGDIDIDSQLLVSIDRDMVQLSNGCICCTINDDLVDAVYRILKRPDPVDYIVIETTGIADPLPIMLTFLGTDLRDSARLDSVITLIDAETFTAEHFQSEAALQQVLYGDMIVLNKTDLIPSEQVETLESIIRAIKPQARILSSEYGQLPLSLLLNVGGSDTTAYDELIQEEIQDSATHEAHGHEAHSHEHHNHEAHSHEHHNHEAHNHKAHNHKAHNHEAHSHKAHSHEHHHHHSDHLDNDGFVSVSYHSDRPFLLHDFQEFVSNLPTNVFRAKGILWFEDEPLRHVFQLVGQRYHLEVDADQSKTATSPQNQLVVIGRNLDSTQIKQQLELCHNLAVK